MTERTTNADISHEISSLNTRVTILEQSVSGLKTSQEQTRGQISTLTGDVSEALQKLGRLDEKLEGVRDSIVAASASTRWILGIALTTLGAVVAGLIGPLLIGGIR